MSDQFDDPEQAAEDALEEPESQPEAVRPTEQSEDLTAAVDEERAD